MMNYGRKSLLAFIGAALSVIVVAIVFSVTAQAEKSWEYAWDADLRETVKFLKIIGWCFVVIAVVDVIQGIAYSVAHEKEENAEAMGSAGQRDLHPTSSAVGTVRCRFCNYLISQNAAKCLHCGTPVSRPVQDRSSTQTKKCLFCGEPMAEKQTFCGACGRRQD